MVRHRKPGHLFTVIAKREGALQIRRNIVGFMATVSALWVFAHYDSPATVPRKAKALDTIPWIAIFSLRFVFAILVILFLTFDTV